MCFAKYLLERYPMSKHRRIEVRFPLAGLNRKGAYKQQPPFSSTSLLNVRAVGTIDGRERGGSRPGITNSHYDSIGDTEPVRLLHQLVLSLGDDFTAWSDTFDGTAMSDAWEIASWADSLPLILQTNLAGIDTSVDVAAAVLEAQNIDSTLAYSVDMLIDQWEGAYHGKYQLFMRMNDLTPDIETEGVKVELTATGSTGNYTITLNSVIGGVSTLIGSASGTTSTPQPAWLTATVSGTTVSVYFNNALVLTGTVAAMSGLRVGFGLECTVDGGLNLVNVFRIQYYSTLSITSLRSMLTASASGDLYYESSYGRLTLSDSNATGHLIGLGDSGILQAAQSGQQLFIADYGDLSLDGDDGSTAGTAMTATAITNWLDHAIDADDDVVVISNGTGTVVDGTYKISSVNAASLTLSTSAGTGNCSYRIERGPKIFDPTTNAITMWTATTGQVPTGCKLIARCFDRIFLGGADLAPNVWYASRQSAPLNFDYSQTDSQRAVAGTASEAGVPGEPLTALIAHSDDYLIMSCRDSMWRLQGDPAYGGALANLSRTVGVIGPQAWCLGPSGELVFLTLDGLYLLPPGGSAYPEPLSRGVLPRELKNVNPALTNISLEYDAQARGVHIFLSPERSNARLHWWMDWERKTFWPVTLQSDHEPSRTTAVQSTQIEDSCVILGGRDGTLRRFSDMAESDCGTVFSSYADLGPIAMNADMMVGSIISIDANVANGSGDLTWGLRAGLSFEGTVNATTFDTGTFTAGENATVYPSCSGDSFVLRLSGLNGRRWEIENISVLIRFGGKKRIQ